MISDQPCVGDVRLHRLRPLTDPSEGCVDQWLRDLNNAPPQAKRRAGPVATALHIRLPAPASILFVISCVCVCVCVSGDSFVTSDQQQNHKAKLTVPRSRGMLIHPSTSSS